MTEMWSRKYTDDIVKINKRLRKDWKRTEKLRRKRAKKNKELFIPTDYPFWN